MARSRDKRQGDRKELSAGKGTTSADNNEDAIVGEIVEPVHQLVNAQVLESLIQRDKQADLKELLNAGRK